MSPKSELSRREALKLGTDLFWAYLIANFGLKYLAKKAISPQGESVSFSTPGADYTLIGGIHGIAFSDGTQIFGGRVDPELLPPDADALVLEFADPYLFSGKPKDVFANFSDRPFSHDLMSRATSSRLDCLIVDIPIKTAFIYPLEAAIEVPAVIFGLDRVAKNIKREKTNSVVDALGLTALGWRAISDFGGGTVEFLGYLQPPTGPAGPANTAQAAFEYLNPQNLALTLRNPAVVAKMTGWEVYYSRLLGRRPHFAMLGGIGHFGLPGWFDLGREKCVGYINTVYQKAVLDLIVEEPEAFYVSARLSFNPDGNLKEEFLADNQLQAKFS